MTRAAKAAREPRGCAWAPRLRERMREPRAVAGPHRPPGAPSPPDRRAVPRGAVVKASALRDLAAVTEAARQADAAALGRLAERVEDLRRRADALRWPPSPPDGADAFAMAAADRHGLWRAARRRALLVELAMARAELEEARARARRSFGRAQAAEALAARAPRGGGRS